MIAARKKRQLFGGGFAQGAQPAFRDVVSFGPFDFFELAFAAFADPFQGLAQTGWRVVLHDASGAFGAKHASIDRVVLVAFDIGDFPALHVHVDPASAGAHIAGGLADLVAHEW